MDRIVWERADGRSVRGDVSDFGRRLTVTAVRRSDAGTYTCTAHYENHVAADDTGAIPSKTHVHHLTVRVELSVSAGETLTCWKLTASFLFFSWEKAKFNPEANWHGT